MTPDEIVSKFSVALDNFEPITDQPLESDLTRLREAIAPLLLQIPYDKTGGLHNLIGIFRAKPAYLKRYGEAFPKPTRVGAYDLEIDDDATAVVRARLEAAHKARRADRATYDTARGETVRACRRHGHISLRAKGPRENLHRGRPSGPPGAPPSRVHRPARP